jgi:hypothetical protein
MATWKRILVEDDVAGDGIIAVTSSASALHTVSLGDPSGLPQLTTPVVINDQEDKFLIWDESESEWNWISADNFPHPPEIHLGNSDLTQTDSTRTFDIFDGGELKFIGNDGAGWKFEGQDTSGNHTLSVNMSYAVDTLSDSNYTMQGLRVSGYSDGQPPKKTGIWIEGSSSGTYAPLIKESQATLTFERGFSSLSAGSYDLGSIDFMGPYLTGSTPVDGSGSEFYDGEGKIFAQVIGGADIGSKNVGYLSIDIEVESYTSQGAPTHTTAQMVGVDQDGVYINSNDTRDSNGALLLNKYKLATNRGSVGQILHTDGLGGTYWEENIPSTYYNSSYGFINAELQTATTYVTTTAFQQIQLDLAQTTTTGVDITEGYNISISTIDDVNEDSVTFSGLDETMDNFSVTISGTIEWITQSSAWVQVYCEAVKSDAGNDQQSLFNSQVPTYKQLILPQTAYQASSGGSAPIGGTSASFSYTVPQIGQIGSDPVEDIVFKMYVQRIYGTGNHYFRLSELNISINN